MCFGVMAFTCIRQHFTRWVYQWNDRQSSFLSSGLSSGKAALDLLLFQCNTTLKRFSTRKLIQYNDISMSSDMVPPDSKRCRLLPNLRLFLQNFSSGATNLLMNTFLITGFYCTHSTCAHFGFKIFTTLTEKSAFCHMTYFLCELIQWDYVS